MNNKTYQTGMTLIEIMIALLIGAFLLGGVLQIFINSKQTYRMQENLSRLQENGRFAMEFLARDIRMAGYWGCISPLPAVTEVTGANNNAVGSVDNIDDGTDTLTLRGAFTQPLVVNPPPAAPVAYPCGSSDITTKAFYTDPSSKIDYKIQNSVLRRTDSGGNWQDLIEGVKDMQILYGVDTDAAGAVGSGTPNYYVPASSVAAADWLKVISIRIALTVQTIDGNLTTTGDGRIRRVFNTTIAVRNRL